MKMKLTEKNIGNKIGKNNEIQCFQSLVFSPDGQPYTVESILVIGPDSSLVIEPGTTLMFQPNAGIQVKGGLRVSLFHLVLRKSYLCQTKEVCYRIFIFGGFHLATSGRLVARGSVQNPVRFTSVTGSQWNGVMFDTGSGQSMLENVIFENALDALLINTPTVVVSGLLIRHRLLINK